MGVTATRVYDLPIPAASPRRQRASVVSDRDVGPRRGRGAVRRLRVVQGAGGIEVAYCTKILADAGADVVFVEPPDGHACGVGGSPADDDRRRPGHCSTTCTPASAASATIDGAASCSPMPTCW